MRLLFDMDLKNYDSNGNGFFRHSARCITIQNGTVAMVHSKKYNYYKFPGGGIEKNESIESALIRETKEEAGLMVIPSSITEYGYVHRVEKSDVADADYFVQDNFYYLCDVEAKIALQSLDAYEADEQFTLEWVTPQYAIDINRNENHGPKNQNMLEREARVLERLFEEGYFIQENEIVKYKQMAELGNAEAQYQLAMRYIYGNGVQENNVAAFELLSKATKQGHIEATYNLGICYHYGHGTEVDLKTAFELYLKSAKAGYGKGMVLVGRFYRCGIYVCCDPKKSKYWLDEAMKIDDEEVKNGVKRELEAQKNNLSN